MNIKIINKINELNAVVNNLKTMQHIPDLINITGTDTGIEVRETYCKRNKSNVIVPGGNIKNIRLKGLNEYLISTDFKGTIVIEGGADDTEPIKTITGKELLQIRKEHGHDKQFIIDSIKGNELTVIIF